MPIDPEWLGKQLQKARRARGLTLQQVAKETGISVASLSRIERGALQNLKSDTLVILTEWLGTEVEKLKVDPVINVPGSKPGDTTPDLVELHLRADKKLDRKTAEALATLFRTVYEQLTEQMKKRG